MADDEIPSDDASDTPSDNGAPEEVPQALPAGDRTTAAGGIVRDLQIDEDLRDSYLSYAMSVIVSRALPDARDGLKPVQRRVLLAMREGNVTSRGKHVKSARICGDTMANYHPHGDQNIYLAMVRLAQPFSTRYPMVDGQGNYGTIDGLSPAAMRYTEARMSRIAEEMLDDLDKDTVETVANYDETRQEPVVLPARFPNLLCNGSVGIAVGMATSIPPHNLGEICDGVMLLIDNPDATLADLLEVIPGPDFPTGGVICGRRGIVDGYATGRSTITLRAKCEIEEVKNGRTQIVVTEIPYMQQKMRLVARIAQAVKDERVVGVSNVQDYSNRKGLRIAIDVKRDADPNVVLNQLYQFTPLQDTVSVIMLALVNGRPQTLSLRAMLQQFIEHRVDVIRRRTQYLLRKARDRAHVVEGLLIALSSLDEVIERIRTSADVPEARERLMGLAVSAELLGRALGDEGFAAFQKIMGAQASYNLTRVQADHILSMQLSRLTALEQDKILAEYAELRDRITEYQRILGDEGVIRGMVRSDTEEIKAKYGDARRTDFAEDVSGIEYEDLIEEEMNVVQVSHSGYIKRLPIDTYRTQGRGGKGVTGGATKEGDFLEAVFVASTHDHLLFFTNMGQCHWLKVYQLPSLSRTSQGRAMVNLLNLREGERVSSYVPVRHFDDRGLLMVTRQGMIKKTPLEDYSRPRAGGIIGISLNEGDELIRVLKVEKDQEIVLATRAGMAIRFDEDQTRPMGRNTRGVRGINLQAGDEVVGAVVAEDDADLLTVCENGYGKRTSFAEYRNQRRGGKGLIDIKTTARNGQVCAVCAVRDGDQAMMISARGMIVRSPVDEISRIGRNTQGVRVMGIRAEDHIVAVAKIASEDLGDDDDLQDATVDGRMPDTAADQATPESNGTP